MPLHVDDFMKISKALEKCYQQLVNENPLESDGVERLNVALEDYNKAMLHATNVDKDLINFGIRD
ncbi:hypothetical protein [Sutcliffiella deserti]|uniref:hypothetical protein n=1 Tax=Sutcliffiella deserti TaxID=2875501 RepID=UPI001CC08AAA|nr:hypothetical protein [Sutcliffiella deserti]